MRFARQILEVYEAETIKGNIVMIPACVYCCAGHRTDELLALQELHYRKIDLADEILVVNIDGYVGSDTQGEIEYAQKVGVPVRFIEPAI